MVLCRCYFDNACRAAAECTCQSCAIIALVDPRREMHRLVNPCEIALAIVRAEEIDPRRDRQDREPYRQGANAEPQQPDQSVSGPAGGSSAAAQYRCAAFLTEAKISFIR